ncbi:sodium:solute symporter [Leptospira bandrabouensis]|uniref:sodium:solute symporter n=1 Tax=Leptospira bandrabouensis TaxID=2484903 RepID=UPI001EEC15FC|nr:sodium:solute symporter [Leptospira bandrabouensis]MCG6152039.1 sodium:solute symporter [Leptospira bandrabouensis]MCW7459694.1 sodium:solute symporter [Leptospira bandrabouensis]MCW7477286.1 sodium:solute symporter [Leptospira bandrabouensis]MCW7484968.1 sodium:solute symporter [Leptospira bandrabouensis]
MFWDLLVLVFYFIIVFYFGFHFAKTNQKEEDFYLAKKEIHWFFLLLSLVATETSSLTFLSIPSLSFKGDYRFLEIALGYLIGRTIVALYLLPSYFSGNTISVYEYVGNRFGKSPQKTLSLVFTVSRLLGDGIRLYVSSLPIAFLLERMGLNLSPEILGMIALTILSIVTIIYSVVGGFRAIVFTDVLQWFIYIFGGIFALGLLVDKLDISIWEGIKNLQTSQKLNLFVFDYLPSGDNSYFILFALIGGAFISIGSHGTDLMLVQRVIATKNLASGQKILIGSGIVVLVQFILFLCIGSLLYLFYSDQTMAPDKVFSQFIVAEVPSPLLGILVAAILASAMSTLSSTINSLSLTWARDWGMDRWFSPRTLSLFFGLTLFISSLVPYFLIQTWEKGILEMGLTIFSYTLGPSIAVFFLAKGKAELPVSGLVFSVFFLTSILSTVAIGLGFQISFTLLIPIGFGIQIFLVQISRLAFKKN